MDFPGSGGDWAGYGTVSGPQFLQMLAEDKIRVGFANNALLIDVQTNTGDWGSYVLDHSESGGSDSDDSDLQVRQEIIHEAASLAGTPYELPPNWPNSVDCSLYVIKVYEECGLTFSPGVRTAEQIRWDTEVVRWEDVKEGDLLFFENTYNSGEAPGSDGKVATHISISLGAGTQRMWSAQEPVVTLVDVNTSYWQTRIIEARKHRDIEDSDYDEGEIILVDAIDVASYQPTDLTEYIVRYDIAHVIVKAYQTIEMQGGREHALAQIQSAKANGCSCDTYCWIYAGISGSQQAADSLSLYKPEILWLDVESYEGVFPELSVVEEAINYCKSMGQRVGIYSAGWVWDHYGNPDVSGWGVPLWAANYNGIPDLESVPLFGGWTECQIHQWTSDPLDRNVCNIAYAG